MTLFQAWKDSLSLLKPKHLKLFLLVTLKSIVDAYKLLLKYWWWLIAITIFCYGAIFLPVNILTRLWVHKIADYLLYDILIFVTLVATRPSLEQKNFAYFKRNIIYFIPIALVYFLPLVLLYFMLLPLGLLIPLTIVTSPLYIFAILFFLDSSLKFKDFFLSLFKTIKMVAYNFPLLLIVGTILTLPEYIFHNYVNISPLLVAGVTLMQIGVIKNILSVLFIPVVVCLYTNIYIKKLHDQFDLYFRQPS